MEIVTLSPLRPRRLHWVDSLVRDRERLCTIGDTNHRVEATTHDPRRHRRGQDALQGQQSAVAQAVEGRGWVLAEVLGELAESVQAQQSSLSVRNRSG